MFSPLALPGCDLLCLGATALGVTQPSALSGWAACKLAAEYWTQLCGHKTLSCSLL